MTSCERRDIFLVVINPCSASISCVSVILGLLAFRSAIFSSSLYQPGKSLHVKESTYNLSIAVLHIILKKLFIVLSKSKGLLVSSISRPSSSKNIILLE